MPALRSFLRFAVVFGLAALPVALAPATAQAATFSNPAQITINDSGSPPTPASPYPSTIPVSGLFDLITDVDVTVSGWNHGAGYDVDVLLVGPSGQKIVLMSDIGGSQSNTTLTFSDGGPFPCSFCTVPSGTYSPTNNNDGVGGDGFASPAPAGPYGSALSAFNNTNPNGVWSLYVVDDYQGFSGSFSGGWSLSISTGPNQVSISDASVTEGNSGTVNANFTVSLQVPTAGLSVQYSTQSDSATLADYSARAGTLTFDAGQFSKTISVPVKGDLIDEADETFLVILSDPSKPGIADGAGEGTILDNDPAPGIYVSDVTVPEGNSGTSGAVFTLSLTNPSSQAITVDYDTDDGTAKAGSDYKAKSGTKVFLPGQTTKTITVSVIGDTTLEQDETFLLNLADPDNAFIVDGQGVGTITDDDRPEVSIDDVSMTEVNSGQTKVYTFHVTLNHATTVAVTVQYATANGTAVAPADYTTKSGTLSFAAGTTSKTVTVTVKGDNTVEPDEYFLVNLANATNATIADGQGVGTIVNND